MLLGSVWTRKHFSKWNISGTTNRNGLKFGDFSYLMKTQLSWKFQIFWTTGSTSTKKSHVFALRVRTDPEIVLAAKTTVLHRFEFRWLQMKGILIYFLFAAKLTGYGHRGLQEPATSEKSPFWHPNFDDLYLRCNKSNSGPKGCIREVFTSTKTSGDKISWFSKTGSGNLEHPVNTFFSTFLAALVSGAFVNDADAVKWCLHKFPLS